MLDAHIDQIDHHLAELRNLRQTLLHTRRFAEQTRRAGGGTVACRIIEPGS